MGVSNDSNDDTRYDNSIPKLRNIFSMAHLCREILTDIYINSFHRHESQQVTAQNGARTFRGIPRVTHHCESEKPNYSFSFLDKLSVGLPQRAEATEIPVRFESPLFCLSLSNQALTLSQWLTLLLIGGQCCYQVPPDGRWLALAQWRNIKAGMEVPGYQLCMKGVATGLPSPLLLSVFLQSPPTSPSTRGPTLSLGFLHEANRFPGGT